MRTMYKGKELALEQELFELRHGSEPDYSRVERFLICSCSLPRQHQAGVENLYIINLDKEVLTSNHVIHWKLGNIPHKDNLWMRAAANSIYLEHPTISLGIYPDEHIASPAVGLLEPNMSIDYKVKAVAPRTDIREARKVFLTRVLAGVFLEYKMDILQLGAEWDVDSFPSRELTFAQISIASGQTIFHSFPAQQCNPWTCSSPSCCRKHLPKSAGWLDKRWVGNEEPLLQFGSMCHRSGDPPRASPTETMYWHEGVLVSLALLLADGAAITKAVTWGLIQVQNNFQIVVLSLFDVAFAEVSWLDDEPIVKVTRAVDLSPLRTRYCSTSTHPRERPEWKFGMQSKSHHGKAIMKANCAASPEKLRDCFTGLTALVNFFDVAKSRRARFTKSLCCHSYLRTCKKGGRFR